MAELRVSKGRAYPISPQEHRARYRHRPGRAVHITKRESGMRVDKPLSYFVSSILTCLALSLPAQTQAQAQDIYPTKQIRMVLCCVGAINAVARAIADEMSDTLGEAVVVEAKPGAG